MGLVIVFGGCQSSDPTAEKRTDKKSPGKTKAPVEEAKVETADHELEEVNAVPLSEAGEPMISALEQRIIDAGLTNVQQLDPTIVVDLKYSTEDNFLGFDIYEDFNRCYLQPDVARKLVQAQKFLKEKHPDYSLKIYDAVRPRSVQQVMWDTLDIPLSERGKYVSNPAKGSLHNFGAAVDLTIVDGAEKELDMGTEFDHFGILAYPTKEQQLLAEGKISEKVIENRKLLREVMGKAGFFNIQTEWWHFNSCYRKEAAAKYQIVE